MEYRSRRHKFKGKRITSQPHRSDLLLVMNSSCFVFNKLLLEFLRRPVYLIYKSTSHVFVLQYLGELYRLHWCGWRSFSEQPAMGGHLLHHLHHNHRFFHGQHLRWFCDRHFSERRRRGIQRLWTGQESGDLAWFTINVLLTINYSLLLTTSKNSLEGRWWD